MFYTELNTLIHILDESPFFMDLSPKDKKSLVEDLLRSYPHLIQQTKTDPDISCGIRWFAERFLR
ncbi:MAG: hypothetical protein AMK71_06330 [Nitrospira bacterium SG8_35_4]|nr:MAG: hypothetical protein AMK71_06330 [Nitrospira bacterium SG8_35_4]